MSSQKQVYIFREEDRPRFRISFASVIALILLALLLLLGANSSLFQLNAEELARLEELQKEQERELSFRFIDQPEDEVEIKDPKFLSDANRIVRSQKETETPENNDPISQGTTYELEKAAPPAVQQKAQPAVETVAQKAQEALPEEPQEPQEQEPPPEPVKEVAEKETTQPDDLGNIPTDPNAPKPYRKFSAQEMVKIKQKAAREMNAFSAQGQSGRETAQYHNSRGRSAPTTGLSIETSRSDLGDYLKILRQLIKSNWRIPNVARYEVSGFAVVSFKIHKDGHFSDIVVNRGSGYEPLDVSSRNAIANTYKAPPLPQHVDEDWIPIKFAFYYNMRAPH